MNAALLTHRLRDVYDDANCRSRTVYDVRDISHACLRDVYGAAYVTRPVLFTVRAIYDDACGLLGLRDAWPTMRAASNGPSYDRDSATRRHVI